MVELRYPVMLAVTSQLFNSDHIVSLINAVKWDIKEIMSQHNSYVDVILRVGTRPSRICAHVLTTGPIGGCVSHVTIDL